MYRTYGQIKKAKHEPMMKVKRRVMIDFKEFKPETHVYKEDLISDRLEVKRELDTNRVIYRVLEREEEDDEYTVGLPDPSGVVDIQDYIGNTIRFKMKLTDGNNLDAYLRISENFILLDNMNAFGTAEFGHIWEDEDEYNNDYGFYIGSRHSDKRDILQVLQDQIDVLPLFQRLRLIFTGK